MCLQFGLVIFWRKDFGTKAAHKMLVKLTPGPHQILLLNIFFESDSVVKVVEYMNSTFVNLLFIVTAIFHSLIDIAVTESA